MSMAVKKDRTSCLEADAVILCLTVLGVSFSPTAINPGLRSFPGEWNHFSRI